MRPIIGGRLLGITTVAFLLLPLDAQEPQFRWIDAQGTPQSARSAAGVPADAWRRVTAEVHGTDATSGERFRTAEGITVVIEGIQAPRLEPDGTAGSLGGAKARARLAELVTGRLLTLEFEGARRLPDGELLAHVRSDDGKLIAQRLLAEGRVRLCLEEGAMRHADDFAAAQTGAQAAHAGVWSNEPPPAPPEPAFHRGISLGLFAQNSDFDYSGFLDEIRDVRASHVVIASPWFMDDWRSNEMWPVDGRTAGWPAIQRVTKSARDRGLAVAFQPMVLLRTGTVEHWRGDVDPTETWLWFRNYGRLVGQWADMARDLGVSLLMVGDEFASLERKTGAWRAVIANARSRFGGRLTYSANWDHLLAPEFWNDLDFVGTTGFHSLTKRDDPTVAELAAAWGPIKAALLELQARVKKPILFTEIGYASQDGANKDPWNYYLNPKKPDLQEQADCYAALFQAWPEASSEFAGMFLWNWWRHEDPSGDTGYSVFGKPAYGVIKRAFGLLADREKK